MDGDARVGSRSASSALLPSSSRRFWRGVVVASRVSAEKKSQRRAAVHPVMEIVANACVSNEHACFHFATVVAAGTCHMAVVALHGILALR